VEGESKRVPELKSEELRAFQGISEQSERSLFVGESKRVPELSSCDVDCIRLKSSEKSELFSFWRIAEILLTRKRACPPKSRRDEGGESKRVPMLIGEINIKDRLSA